MKTSFYVLAVVYLASVLVACGKSGSGETATVAPIMNIDESALTLLQLQNNVPATAALKIHYSGGKLEIKSSNPLLLLQPVDSSSFSVTLAPNTAPGHSQAVITVTLIGDHPEQRLQRDIPVDIYVVTQDEFALDAKELSFLFLQDNPVLPGAQVIKIRNLIGALSWEVMGEGQDWLDLKSEGTPVDSLRVGLRNTADLSPGMHSATVRFRLSLESTAKPLALDVPIDLNVVSASDKIYAAADSKIRKHGRFVEQSFGEVTLGYPGASLDFNFKGRSLSINARTLKQRSFIDVVVDDLPAKTYTLANLQQLELFTSEQIGQHHVQIFNRTEAFQGAASIASISVEQGSLLPLPDGPTRKLMFIGASVSCGALSDRGVNCTLDDTSWNGRLAHGILLGQALNAESQLVCIAGRGILSGASANPPTDAFHFIDYALPDLADPVIWDHSLFQPDAVIIALGNNDPVENTEAFIGQYLALLNKILTVYPKTEIILTEGPLIHDEANKLRKTMLTNNLTEIIRRFNHAQVRQMPSEYYPPTGCDGHPTVVTHGQIAKELEPKIRALLNW